MAGDRKRTEISSNDASGRDTAGSTLVPMLIAGLVLVLVGAVILMQFV